MISTRNILFGIRPQTVTKLSFRGISNPNELKSDTFERTTPVKTDYTVEKNGDSVMFQRFMKFVDDNDFLSHISETVDDPENYIGSGFEGTTYAVPKNDDWIVKTYKRSFIIPLSVEKPLITETRDITPGLNIGQNVANIRIPCGKSSSFNYHILQRQKGKPFGVPYDISDFVIDSTVKKYNLSLAKLASSPDSTFDKLVKDVKTVTDYGYEFDYNNPDNFFYDDGKREINFVDIHDKLNRDTEQYEQVLFGITSGNFLKNYAQNDKFQFRMPKTKQLLYRVEGKMTKAMLKEGVKFHDNEVTDKLIEYGILCNKVEGGFEDKKEYLRNNNLLS